MQAVKKERRKTGRVILVIILAVVVVFCAASLFVGNLMFDFILNPESEHNLLSIGIPGVTVPAEADSEQTAPKITGAGYNDTQFWLDYSKEAALWFERESEARVMEKPDGTHRTGYFFPNDGHLYAIVFHGYYGNAAQMAGYVRMFHELGMSVLAPDALAHGESGGDYIGMGWLERSDVVDWVDSIAAADPQAQVVLFGVSMGGATVMMASGEELHSCVRCIVEDCGYTSVYDEFSSQIKQLFHLPKFPLLYSADVICRVRAGYGFREASAVEQLKKATVPMLFIHGSEDTFVPYEMLDRVYDACASEEKEKLTIPGAPHGAAVAIDPATYWCRIEQFVGRFMDLETE